MTCGLFVGMVIHRTIRVRDLFVILREAGVVDSGGQGIVRLYHAGRMTEHDLDSAIRKLL